MSYTSNISHGFYKEPVTFNAVLFVHIIITIMAALVLFSVMELSTFALFGSLIGLVNLVIIPWGFYRAHWTDRPSKKALYMEKLNKDIKILIADNLENIKNSKRIFWLCLISLCLSMFIANGSGQAIASAVVSLLLWWFWTTRVKKQAIGHLVALKGVIGKEAFDQILVKDFDVEPSEIIKVGAK